MEAWYRDMPSCKDTLKQLREWLVQGRVDAETLVDFPWEVLEEEEQALKVIHPKFPVGILIVCDDEIGVVRLLVNTDISTISLDNDARLRLYHKLLKMNATPLTKFILYGDDDVVNIAVDLSTKTLGKQEFNDALALLIASLNALVKELGIEEEFSYRMLTEILRLVKKHLDEGWGRDKLVEYLVKRAGMKREEAEEIVKSLLSESRSGVPPMFT